jgi:hypothetical protein
MMFTWCAGWLCGLHEHGASAQGCVVHEELLHCGGLEMSDIYLVPGKSRKQVARADNASKGMETLVINRPRVS